MDSIWDRSRLQSGHEVQHWDHLVPVVLLHELERCFVVRKQEDDTARFRP